MNKSQQIERTFRGTSVKIKPQQSISMKINQFGDLRSSSDVERGGDCTSTGWQRKRKMSGVNRIKMISSSTSHVTLVVLGIFLLALVDSLTCDTSSFNQLKHPKASHRQQQQQLSLNNQPKAPPSPAHQQQSTSSARKQPQPADKRQSAAQSAAKSHREQNLLSLSESIEQQHFKQQYGGPSKLQSLVQLKQTRPTKFDNNVDDWRTLTGHEAPRKNKKDSSGPSSVATRKQQRGSASKAEDEMRQIMMMHEHAAGRYDRHRPAISGATSNKNDDGKSTTSQSKRVVSKVLSYLASSQEKSTGERPAEALPMSGSESVFAHLSPILNPFSARANSQLTNTKTSHLIRDLSKNLLLGQPIGPAANTSLDEVKDLLAESSTNSLASSGEILSPSQITAAKNHTTGTRSGRYIYTPLQALSNEFKSALGTVKQLYFQEPLKNVLTLTQLPILSSATVSTAPSDLESGGKQWLANKLAAQQVMGNRSASALDDILRYAYILGTGVRRKRDPLKVLTSTPAVSLLNQRYNLFNQRAFKHSLLSPSRRPMATSASIDTRSASNQQKSQQPEAAVQPLSNFMQNGFNSLLLGSKNAKPRGVVWDMATDPSLAVTVFHLLERASVALPLGFLLMPFVSMVRNPLSGFHLGRILPPRASHRSVDYEELAKRLDMMDKILSRALRQTHRDSTFMGK